MKTTTVLRRLSSVLCLAVLCVSAAAETIALSRQQASDLYAALSRLEPGLNAANAITAADNLIELRPTVEALDKGKVAAQRQIRALPKTDDLQAKAEAIVDVLEARGAEVVKLDLTRIDITADEITAAKIPPGQLAIIRQWLRPKAK
jgi:hypothetical protein